MLLIGWRERHLLVPEHLTQSVWAGFVEGIQHESGLFVSLRRTIQALTLEHMELEHRKASESGSKELRTWVVAYGPVRVLPVHCIVTEVLSIFLTLTDDAMCTFHPALR
jgi:hypothetical protein